MTLIDSEKLKAVDDKNDSPTSHWPALLWCWLCHHSSSNKTFGLYRLAWVWIEELSTHMRDCSRSSSDFLKVIAGCIHRLELSKYGYLLFFCLWMILVFLLMRQVCRQANFVSANKPPFNNKLYPLRELSAFSAWLKSILLHCQIWACFDFIYCKWQPSTAE